jgi:hypothetical protein
MVTVCKLVPTQVQRQVAMAAPAGCGNGCGPAAGCGSPCGAPACGSPCGAPACDPCGTAGRGGLLSGLKNRVGGIGDRVHGLFAKIRSLGSRKCAAPSCDLGCGAAPACGGCH